MRAAVVHVVLAGRGRWSGRAHTDAREEERVKQEQRVVKTREQSGRDERRRRMEVRHGGSGVTVMERGTKLRLPQPFRHTRRTLARQR